MSQVKYCPKCQRPTELAAPQCAACGHLFRTQFAAPADQTIMGPSGAPYPAPAPQYPAAPEYSQHPPQQLHVNVGAPQVYFHGPERAVRNDLCAIFSLAFGLLGLLFFCLFGWVFGLVGLGLGVASIFRLRNDRYLDGLPIAISGIVLSTIPLVFGLWFLALWAQSSSQAGQTPTPVRSPSTAPY